MNIQYHARKTSCRLAVIRATHPNLLWIKVNSRHDKVAVTDGKDDIPKTTSKNVATAPENDFLYLIKDYNT